MTSRPIRRRGTFGLDSDTSSASSERPFVDTEDLEEPFDRELTSQLTLEHTEQEVTRPLSPEPTEATSPLEGLSTGNEGLPRLTAESKDFTLLTEPEHELEEYTPFPEQEQDEDKLSLITEETDLAGPLTQSFAAYGFNPFELRPTEKTREFTSFPFPPLPLTSTISPKKMAQEDVNMADGTKDTEIKMNMPKPFTSK